MAPDTVPVLPVPAQPAPSAPVRERTGYDADFLSAPVPMPLPAQPWDGGADALVQLAYVHFSVLLRRDRRLAAATAVNVDGGRLADLGREGIQWRLDRRVRERDQVGAALYGRNDLDRGHLVRRQDPVWGGPRTAEQANLDTFHYTNAAPQVATFNQSKELWLGLEDLVLEHADVHDQRLTVLTGPVLLDDDPEYRGVRVPRSFWKVVAWDRADGLAATGYLLDQADLLAALLERDRRAREGQLVPRADLGAYRTFQVALPALSARTGLDLGPLVQADRFARRVRAGDANGRPVEQVELTGAGDLVL